MNDVVTLLMVSQTDPGVVLHVYEYRVGDIDVGVTVSVAEMIYQNSHGSILFSASLGQDTPHHVR